MKERPEITTPESLARFSFQYSNNGFYLDSREQPRREALRMSEDTGVFMTVEEPGIEMEDGEMIVLSGGMEVVFERKMVGDSPIYEPEFFVMEGIVNLADFENICRFFTTEPETEEARALLRAHKARIEQIRPEVWAFPDRGMILSSESKPLIRVSPDGEIFSFIAKKGLDSFDEIWRDGERVFEEGDKLVYERMTPAFMLTDYAIQNREHLALVAGLKFEPDQLGEFEHIMEQAVCEDKWSEVLSEIVEPYLRVDLRSCR